MTPDVEPFHERRDLFAHYTTASVAFEHVLPERRLRLSPYRYMRDPAENKDLVPGTAFWGAQPGSEQGWLETVAELKRIRDGCRVLSLTEDAGDAPDNFGACWARPRMWEQYADAHRGVCLVFDRPRLVTALHLELESVGSFFRDSVRYTAAGIAESATTTIIDDRIFDPKQRTRAVNEHIYNNYGDFFFLKSDDFASEREYRVVLLASADEFAYVGYRDALVAVIVGERFPSGSAPGRASCATWQASRLAGCTGSMDDPSC